MGTEMFRLSIIIALFFMFIPVTLAGNNNSSGGFIDFNIYPYLSDVNNDNSITINAGAKLTNGFSYFGFTNFSNQSNESELSDLNSFYSEQNIRWKMGEQSPLDLTYQMNIRSGENNDRHRLGIRWRLNDTAALHSLFKSMNIKWSINFHLLQVDDVPADIWQMEHVFRMTFPKISNRIYLSGFIDHTFNEDLASNIPNNPIVAEFQIGYRMLENFYAVTEYRLNQYRQPNEDNLAVGLEYIIKW